jgi:hypothetical protein
MALPSSIGPGRPKSRDIMISSTRKLCLLPSRPQESKAEPLHRRAGHASIQRNKQDIHQTLYPQARAITPLPPPSRLHILLSKPRCIRWRVLDNLSSILHQYPARRSIPYFHCTGRCTTLPGQPPVSQDLRLEPLYDFLCD